MNYRLKNIFFFILSVSAILTIGIAIYIVTILDAKNLSETEISCGKEGAYRIISENHIENLLTTKAVVSEKIKQVVDGQTQLVMYTDSYTLFGIRLATAASLCNSKTK